MNVKDIDFIYYAEHPKFGQLIIVASKKNSYRDAFIYSTRMIHERLKPRMNPAIVLELGVGPFGFIAQDYYAEAGFDLEMPFMARMIALICEREPDFIENKDAELQKIVIAEWDKRYP